MLVCRAPTATAEPDVNEIMFQALLAAAPDAILIVNVSGQIVVANDQAQHLFGYPHDVLLGMNVDLLLPEALRAHHVTHREHYTELPHTRPMGSGLNLWARHNSGSLFTVEVSLSAFQLPDQMLVTAIIRDSTHHKITTDALAQQVERLEVQRQALTDRLTAAESAVLQAARLSAVGQLAAAIAHEINNPLFAARNSLALLEQELSETDRTNPFLGIARDEMARIAGIIERMRDFYRPDPGTFAPVDIRVLLERTLALVDLTARHVNVQTVLITGNDTHLAHGNADQLRQVFVNLMMNAVEAMPHGGMLSVRVASGPSVVVVEIADTGTGIAEEIRPRLFEPFFTNKPNGTGLGLSISGHIITQHGGQIEVDSTVGKGSTFRVMLPRSMHASEKPSH